MAEVMHEGQLPLTTRQLQAVAGGSIGSAPMPGLPSASLSSLNRWEPSVVWLFC